MDLLETCIAGGVLPPASDSKALDEATKAWLSRLVDAVTRCDAWARRGGVVQAREAFQLITQADVEAAGSLSTARPRRRPGAPPRRLAAIAVVAASPPAAPLCRRPLRRAGRGRGRRCEATQADRLRLSLLTCEPRSFEVESPIR